MHRIPSKVVYLGLSAMYLVSSFGVDKVILGTAAAAGYLVLALARNH